MSECRRFEAVFCPQEGKAVRVDHRGELESTVAWLRERLGEALDGLRDLEEYFAYVEKGAVRTDPPENVTRCGRCEQQFKKVGHEEWCQFHALADAEEAQ